MLASSCPVRRNLDPSGSKSKILSQLRCVGPLYRCATCPVVGDWLPYGAMLGVPHAAGPGTAEVAHAAAMLTTPTGRLL